jgi:hypothetical protein
MVVECERGAEADTEMAVALESLAEAIDGGNEYRRVVFEHEAIAELRNTLRL